jgi:hypothetical protein
MEALARAGFFHALRNLAEFARRLTLPLLGGFNDGGGRLASTRGALLKTNTVSAKMGRIEGLRAS